MNPLEEIQLILFTKAGCWVTVLVLLIALFILGVVLGVPMEGF